jgi:DNA repair exonuclease SbcCD ATPase subunit
LQEEAELALAEQRHTEIKAQIQELARQLDAVPEEERRPVVAVEAQLSGARGRRRDADDARQAARNQLRDLQRHRETRLKLEEQRKQSERQHYLHKRLAKLLGREELQRHIMLSAEREIVRHANEILRGLSRGRMRLSLRSDDDATGATGKSESGQKALDLQLLNEDTGHHPMDIALASGSQCFRVAISLALAMGRYFGQEGRRVESVIIDEGFGCLDKASREDTIEVISSLQEKLKRIILVSHQDEFAHEFKNGYAIRLVERSSVVTRMTD